MDKFIVMEIQTNADGSVGNLVSAYGTREEADSKYYAVLSAAALSSIPVHACVLLDNSGGYIDSHVYLHGE